MACDEACGRETTRLDYSAGLGVWYDAAVPHDTCAVPASAWSQQTIKEGSTGPMVAVFAPLRVLGVREGLPGPEVWLILRRHVQTGALQTSLSHAPQHLPLMTLVRTSGMR